MDRKTFLKTSIGTSVGIGLIPNLLQAGVQSDPEPFKTTLVKEFVVAGHKDLNHVRQMLAEYPNLLYSRYDWGNGDFEEAIEGAGHLGNKEIANYLIEQGSRVNLFVLTMLGKTELVQPILEEYPKLLWAKGAHGFTLLHHAHVGGDDAKELHTYLIANGLTETHIKIK